MTKYYCDRCKNETRGYFYLNIVVENESPFGNRNTEFHNDVSKANSMMLCEECISEILCFVKNEGDAL